MKTYTKFPGLEEYLKELSVHHLSHADASRQDTPSCIIRNLGYGDYESALDLLDEYAETLPEDEAAELWDKADELRKYAAKKAESKKAGRKRNLKENRLEGLVMVLDDILDNNDGIYDDNVIVLADATKKAISLGDISKAIDFIDTLAGEYLDEADACELWDEAAVLRQML